MPPATSTALFGDDSDADFFEPNLPGWRPRPPRPSTFFKPQTLVYAQGGVSVDSLPIQRDSTQASAKNNKAPSSPAVAGKISVAAAAPCSTSATTFPTPRYVAHAGVVLRYKGWFSEPVPEGSSRLEAAIVVGGGRKRGEGEGASSSSSPHPSLNGVRIRHVELRLHLEDATADVVERKVPNSGLQQGLIVRRHRLTRRAARGGGNESSTKAAATTKNGGKGENDDGDDAPLGFEDVRVGDVFRVYGREITICDADAATRAWLSSAAEREREEQMETSSSPSSIFAGLPGDPIPVPEGDYEVSMRAAAAAREAGKARRCAEVSAPSSARLWDPMPVPAGGWRPAARAPGSEDTRSIMARLFGGGSGSGDDEKRERQQQPREKKAPLVLPPHTGFGSEEDSARSCEGLVPRPRVRRAPLDGDVGVECRFSAKLAGPSLVPGAGRISEGSSSSGGGGNNVGGGNDAERKFSVRFYPADGAVAVFEERANGYPGGKFLERAPVKRPACACGGARGGASGFRAAAPGISACGACGGSSDDAASPSPSTTLYYSESDFYVGAPLRLHGRGFLLTSADESTLRRMEKKSPLAKRGQAVAAARSALLEANAASLSASASSTASAVELEASDLFREALASVSLQKQHKQDDPKRRDNDGRRGEGDASSSSLPLLTPEELGEAFAAAGAPLSGPPQVLITLARALGGDSRKGNLVDAVEAVERLFG